MSESNYLVLARKYRPQSLSDVVGQDVLVQTIRNALSLNRLPQAILLTGTRGIGKTTTARIIAKHLNCTETNALNTTECCNKCDSCISIANCSHPDVLEFDAASKTSVNDIRDIIDSVQYHPIKSKHKFYIIDEVHMLSNSAFNALLKTLEEPPSHVRFILATTDENKVPLTITSRCLQFRLKPIKYQIISRRCGDVLHKEGYSAEDNVVEMIAQAANGSVRDALSILEGAIIFCADENKKLLLQSLNELLGYKHHAKLRSAFQMLCEGDLNCCLKQIIELYDFGVDAITMVSDMLHIVHEMTTKKVSGEPIAVEIPFLLRAWHVLSDTISQMKNSDNQMIQFEMSLIKLAHLNTSTLPEDLLEKNNGADENNGMKAVIKAESVVVEDVMTKLLKKSQEDLPSLKNIQLLDPANNFLTMRDTIKTFNNLRVLLAFLLDIGEAILYHRLSSVVRISVFDLEKQMMAIDQNAETVNQIKLDMSRVTGVKWSISAKKNSNAMTYADFLNLIDKQHEKALLQTDIVKYILSKFSDLKVDKITLNNNLN